MKGIAVGFVVAALILSGCASVVERSSSGNYKYAYTGVRTDLHDLNTKDALFVPFIIIDLPFSFVLDTILLPVDGVIYAIDSNN